MSSQLPEHSNEEMPCLACGKMVDILQVILTKDDIICPQCGGSYAYGTPKPSSGRAGRMVWIFVTLSTTIAICIYDGLVWTTALWVFEMGALGLVHMPVWKKIVEKRKHRKWSWCWDVGFSLLVIGLPLGAFFGVLLGVLYQWDMPLHQVGVLGMCIGPLVVLNGLFYAMIVVLLLMCIKIVGLGIARLCSWLWRSLGLTQLSP